MDTTSISIQFFSNFIAKTFINFDEKFFLLLTSSYTLKQKLVFLV